MPLRSAGLVTATRQGRQQQYRMNAAVRADALAPWLAKYQPCWPDALARFRNVAEAREPPD
jgi:hypothetical protein